MALYGRELTRTNRFARSEGARAPLCPGQRLFAQRAWSAISDFSGIEALDFLHNVELTRLRGFLRRSG